jgi:hypothetical protein
VSEYRTRALEATGDSPRPRAPIKPFAHESAVCVSRSCS